MLARCLPVLILPLLGGCLISHSQKRVIREGEVRQPIRFESEETALLFNEMATSDEARKSEGSSASFGIPFLVGLSRSSVPSHNAFYNDQVSKCDVNGDGLISDCEAEEFAARPR